MLRRPAASLAGASPEVVAANVIDGKTTRRSGRKRAGLAPPYSNDAMPWLGLNAVVVIDSRRESAGAIEHETRLDITSPTLPAARLGPIVRSRLAFESSL